MARFEELKRNETIPSVIFQRLCERETLAQIARAWAVPRGQFVEWFMTEHSGLFESAQKVIAADYMHESVAIADNDEPRMVEVSKKDGKTVEVLVLPDPARDRLRVDTRLKVAGKFDRKRWGEESDGPRLSPVILQIANLRGDTTVQVSAPAEAPVVIEQRPLEPTRVALPADLDI